MFIRKKSKKDSKTGKKYFTYQLVQSTRTSQGPRQEILLSIGINLELTDGDRKILAKRIEELSSGVQRIIPYPEKIEHLANTFAKQLIKKRANQKEESQEPKETFETVELDTLEHKHCRTVGIEHVSLEAFRKLKLDKKLFQLGMNKKEVELACGMIIGRLVKPGSERASHYWLQNLTALDELLGCDFNNLSLSRVYKIGDKLFSKKKALEDHLCDQERNLFSFNNAIALYDITNTYFEGMSKRAEKTKRGRSKEKRSDCPLVALGLVLNEEGFPMRSEFFEGNVSEPSTLKNIINSLGYKNDKKPVIILDAGITTEENLKWLRENQYAYIVCSRTKKEIPEDLDYEIVKEQKDNRVKAACVKQEETKEVLLYCHSQAREQKEIAMKLLFQKRFEEALKQLRDGLYKKGCLKNYEKILEKIGRLKNKYSSIARFYQIQVEKGENGKAIKINWESSKKVLEDNFNGTYCLRAFGLDLETKKLWKLYVMLTKVEDGFRSLKSDLGLRPIYHQVDHRIDSHLFISLLAFHLMQTILYQLKLNGINIRWETFKTIMSTQTRVTTTVRNQKGKTIHIRSSSVAEPAQKMLCDLLKIPEQPGRRTKAIF